MAVLSSTVALHWSLQGFHPATARTVVQYVINWSTAGSESTSSVISGTTVKTLRGDLTHLLCWKDVWIVCYQQLMVLISVSVAARAGGFLKSLPSDPFRGRCKICRGQASLSHASPSHKNTKIWVIVIWFLSLEMKFWVEIQKLSKSFRKRQILSRPLPLAGNLKLYLLKSFRLRTRVDSMPESLQAKTSLDYSNKSFHILDELSLSTTRFCSVVVSFATVH